MVSAFGLLEHREVRLHLGFVLKRGSVNALQLGIALVAFVISAGHVSKLERADVSSAHHVRSGAKVCELAVNVE